MCLPSFVAILIIYICIKSSTRDATWTSLAIPGDRHYRRVTASTPSGREMGNGLNGDNGDTGDTIAVCSFHRSKIFLKGLRGNRGCQASTLYTPLISHSIRSPSPSKKKCSICATRWAYRRQAFPLSSQVLVNDPITPGGNRTISAHVSMKLRRQDFHMAIL